MIAEMNRENERLVKKLIEKKMTISAAESCTGGLFSALITDVPGSSAVLEESIVTYSNDAKMRELGVSKETLDTEGAVSFQTAKQMCEGIARHTGSDIGVGITGIAGPGGGSEQKPVGTVFVGISIEGETAVYELHWEGDRGKVREKTCKFIFEELCEQLG